MTTQTPPGAPPPSSADKRKRFAVIAGLLVVIAGLAAAAGLVMVNRNDDRDVAEEASYVVMDTPNVTPVFEPRDARGNDPFFPLEVQLAVFQSEVEDEVFEQVRLAQENAEPGETVETPEFDVAALDANVKTGLYGGTEENTCDPERLISFLYANPDLGEAWAKVQGIEFSAIADYIRSLEVRVLAEPVNVLNHGYNATTGAPYEIDSVLDAGTAVLVDKNGDVRTRCYCGNPIKPKPPTDHMPPRCIVFGAYVFVEPGGVDKRNGAPRDVLLTGRETTIGGLWIEVKWGTEDNQKGWVRSDNLRKHYCPPPTYERLCPGPDAVSVWANPNENNKVGKVTGVVRLHDQNVDIFAPLSPVGGIGSEVIINDFMLIRFKQAAPSVQNSAWVKVADLNQNDDECERIRQCVNTEGPVWERAGGALLPGAGGVRWVEFTGHFAADPVTHAEIRLNNGAGNYGWISQFYTPLPPERCEPPIRDCVEGDWTVYETSTQTDPNHLGYLNNAQVDVIGGPQDGRLQIEFAPGGPEGWVDQAAFYDGHNDCRPTLECYITTAAAWTEYPTNGASIPPIAMPTILEHRGKIVDGAPAYTRIGVAGIGYWIESTKLIPLHPSRCDPEPPDCSSSPLRPIDDFLEGDQRVERLDPATTRADSAEPESGLPENDDSLRRRVCCVNALFNTPNVGDVAAVPTPALVIVVGQIEVSGETWFITSSGLYFRAVDVLSLERCRMPECLTPTDYPGRDEVPLRRLADELDAGETIITGDATLQRFPDRPAGGDCCVNALYTGPNFASPAIPILFPVLVDVVAGPVGDSPAWFQTSDGAWFPETAIVDASACRPITCPTDSSGIATLRSQDDLLIQQALSIYVPGANAECCISGQVFDAPNGAPVDVLDEPTAVLVVDISDDGEWYQVVIEGEFRWVPKAAFLSNERCRPQGECPLPGSQVRIDNLGRRICCVQLTPAGAAPFFEEVVLTGETRPADAGGTEYNTVDNGWVHEDQFVGAGRCAPTDASCPSFSIVDAQDPLTCCVAIGNDFQEVMLTGETRDIGAGVLEYNTVADGWILETDFVGGGRCAPDPCPNGVITNGVCCNRGEEVVNGQCVPPCPTGEQRNSNGVCFAPSTPTTPAPCRNSDRDTLCDSVDNCPFNTNESQQDSNNNGVGDACDVCSDGDGDRVCDNEDNCPEFPNPNQVDNNANGIGDACEQCADTDGDLVCNSDDNCPRVWNNDQADVDEDGIGDVCDAPACSIGVTGGSGDTDKDGICDPDDNCIRVSNSDQADSDGDGVGDKCDNCPNGDADGDGFCDDVDNCVNVFNTSQLDVDQDGVGNDCDRCPFEFNPNQNWTWDTNQDGINDACTPIIS